MMRIRNCFTIVKSVLKKLGYFSKSYFQIKLMGNECDIEKALDLVYNSAGGFLKPLQRPAEIKLLLEMLAERKPKVIVEIGTASGGNLYLFTRIASENAVIVSIDLPSGNFGGGYRRWRLPMYHSFARPHQQIYLIRRNSHALETVERLKAILKGNKIDFLFIDGDHSYDGVKKDFDIYRSFLNSDGIVAFHDIVVHSRKSACTVHRFWQEIKGKFKHEEIVEDWGGQFAGIGLVMTDGQ